MTPCHGHGDQRGCKAAWAVGKNGQSLEVCGCNVADEVALLHWSKKGLCVHRQSADRILKACRCPLRIVGHSPSLYLVVVELAPVDEALPSVAGIIDAYLA